MSSGRPVRLLFVAGARPNFMKVAPVMSAVRAWNGSASAEDVRFVQTLVHTGQHYDRRLSDVFFEQLGLSEPEHHLGVGSGPRAAQIELVRERLGPVLVGQHPDLVVVVGDVNSTAAATQCASGLGISVAHVEAGLRSGDPDMPEELNRLITDRLAELLFTTESTANENLVREGVDPARVHFVGNTMIDTLDRLLPLARALGQSQCPGLVAREYGLVTMHRPSNVDDSAQLSHLVGALNKVAGRVPLVWPVHPRTRSKLAELEPIDSASEHRLQTTEPLGYLDFLALMVDARLVLTDSGGVQEETTVLGVPCLTLRTTTERPVTVSEGTNRLVNPFDTAAVEGAVIEVLAAPLPAVGHRPALWDGHASERIVAIIADWAGKR